MQGGSNVKKISSDTSIILDSLRIAAALTVVIFHGFEQWFPDEAYAESKFARLAHTAVIIFFVLSGYVIAYTTSRKKRGGLQYSQARLSRLCSIVIPALVISALCQMVIYVVNPKLYEVFSRPPIFTRYLITALYSNEIWFFSSAPPIDGPLWSLSYEFWFYTIFGLILFSPRGSRRILFVLIGCLIAGPKILLMMPIWLMGCAAYYLPSKHFNRKLIFYIALALVVLTLIATIYFPLLPKPIGTIPFYFANQFLTDWLLGFLIATGIWLVSGSRFESHKKSYSQKLRKIADLTFPLYVLHNPLFVLIRAFLPTQLTMYGKWQL